MGDGDKLGPHYIKGKGTNFAVYAPEAENVQLCLFDSDENQLAKIDMPGKKGRVWHVFVEGVKPGQLYGYRVSGQYSPENGLFHDPNKLLIDPYAKKLNRAVCWNERLYQDDSQHMVPKGVLIDHATFDWQQTPKPNIPDSDTVLYETHVKGFTKLHPKVKEEYKGTYLGLIEPSVIRYLKELGVTSLQLMPVMAFMSEPRLEQLGLSNYWGYNPINFLLPNLDTQLKTLSLSLKPWCVNYIKTASK